MSDTQKPTDFWSLNPRTVELQRENADLRAKLEEATKDAERYRWLRGRALSVDWSYRLSANWRQSECRRSGEQMDTSIDAAIAKEKP